MADKREKKKLSSKQTSIISWTISIVCFICMFISVWFLNLNTRFELLCWAVTCVCGTMFIFYVFYGLTFNVIRREREERIKELEKYLSFTDFKQVYFIEKDYADVIVNTMNQIIQKEEYKFYAKLTENQNIYLIVKDKHNQEVYCTEIKKPVCFNSNFRFK